MDSETLHAALIGYHFRLDQIKKKMAEIQKELGPDLGTSKTQPLPAARGKRGLSAAARQRISEAQKLRWAKVRGK